ncbi:hypothetical protein [Acinetobacter bereziniae]|uniref:hypothetical protein n=1 Tax=Acinetobacter bereziniae TaxID=106648 RepID=UPI002090601A|nr:hypothetical protein [Acinetobacter bereziniae]
MAAAHYNEQKQQSSQNQNNQQNSRQAQQPNRNQNNQANGQQQKPLAQRFNDALLAIKDAKNPQTLDKAINTFKGTQYEIGISNACRARADQMGWVEAPPPKQIQQQNQVHH